MSVLIYALIASVRRNLELIEKIEDLTDQVEISLDIIDDCYGKISKVSNIPAASDDPIVRQLLADIKHTKNALLLIANMITFTSDEFALTKDK